MCSSSARGNDAASSSAGSEQDVWASDDEGDLEHESRARRQQFYNAGYRDGVDAGKERTLQTGFDIGFKEGARAGFEWAALRAAAKTAGIIAKHLPNAEQAAPRARRLASRVEAVGVRPAMLAFFRQALSKTPDASAMPPVQGQQEEDVSEALQRLQLAPAQPVPGAPNLQELPDISALTQEFTSELHSLGLQVSAAWEHSKQ